MRDILHFRLFGFESFYPKDAKYLFGGRGTYSYEWILWAAKTDGEYCRNMFAELYCTDGEVMDRVEKFISRVDFLQSKYKNSEGNEKRNKSFHDLRTVMIYLTLKFPEKYYFYKYGTFKAFAELVDYDYLPRRAKKENLSEFTQLCDKVREIILQDKELLGLYKLKKDEYFDPEYHLLVQDIIFSLCYEAAPEKLGLHKIVKPKLFNAKATDKQVELKGKITDYVKEYKNNKKIGDVGELFIFTEECKKLKEYKLGKDKKVEWTAREKGDGLGYDIRSYDSDGNEIYIEVKTTTGGEDNDFYVTANELEKSKQCPDKYYLYRVYNLNLIKGTGKYSVRKGSLEDLCIMPVNYHVKFK